MPPMEMSERDALLIRFHIIQETLIHLGRATIGKGLVFERDEYADGLVKKAGLQMLTIRNIFEQGEWQSGFDNRSYNYIIDPLSVATVLRGAYECMLTLNHVFVNPPSQDEVELRYLLWVLSTFISKDQAKPVLFAEDQGKRDQNRKSLEDTVNHMLTLDIVAALDEQSKSLIRSKLDVKSGDHWEYYVNGTRLDRVKGGWHGLAERMPAGVNVFNNLYKLFSINSHPTWHSINVVVHAFELEGEEPENFRMMDTMLSFSAMIGAFIIYDYCILFDVVREEFDALPPPIREVINFYLSTFKGAEFML